MNLFPESLLAILIYGSLVLTGLGGLILLALLFRDWKNKELW